MPSIKRQQGCGLGLAGAFSDHGIEAATTAHPLFHQRAHGGHIKSSTQSKDPAMLDEVPFKERPGIGRRQPMRSRKPREDSLRLHQSRSWDCQLLAAIKAPLEFGGSRGVVFVPRADCRNHAAGIEDEQGSHQRGCRKANCRRVRSTALALSRATFRAGLATRSRPWRSIVTGSGCGSISSTPSRQRTSRGVPGSSSASRRMSLGMTRRPALSMVVSMVLIIP